MVQLGLRFKSSQKHVEWFEEGYEQQIHSHFYSSGAFFKEEWIKFAKSRYAT